MKNLDEKMASTELLEKFLASTPPGVKKSPLHEHLSALKLLRDKNYTLKQIQEYLKDNKVDVSIAWLSAFLRSHDESRVNKNIYVKPNSSQTARASGIGEKTAVAQTRPAHPLAALVQEPKEGEYNPLPKHTFQLDESTEGK